MSKIGKKPILIPEGVKVEINQNKIKVEGPKGKLEKNIPSEVDVQIREGMILVSPRLKTKKNKTLWGTIRQIIYNMVEGVTKGFEKKLEIEGLGYRASLSGDELSLEVGFSHPVKIKKPEGINFSVEKNIITVSGIDKELVGQIAANIRKVRPPDPYKGKGIRYFGEAIRKKASKKAVAAAK
jgi:large subunit ribosomal protein L6